MKKYLLISYIALAWLLLKNSPTSAQNKIEIGLLGIPSFSTINTGGNTKFYKYIHPLNYGLRVNYQMRKLCFSSGILRLIQGTKFRTEITTTDIPEGGIGSFDFFLRAKGIILPINCDYIILKTDGISVFAGLGLYNGYIYSQQQENTSIPKDYKQDPNLLTSTPIKRFNDIEIVNKYYCGINMDIGLKVKLNKHFSFDFRPNFVYQLRKQLPADKYVWTNRLMSFSLDIGFYYSFKEKEN
jgi:hypothetical protein